MAQEKESVVCYDCGRGPHSLTTLATTIKYRETIE